MSTTEPRRGSLAERVTAREGELSSSERRVARYLADHPDEVVFASAEELGRLTGTSDATVIRTVKSLGYAGLPSLKELLRESLRTRLAPAGRLGRSLDEYGSEPKGLLTRVLEDHVHLLEEARRTIDPEEFARVVRLMGGARETVVYGLGGLGTLAEYLVTRLSRMRHRARVARSSGYLLADDLLALSGEDVLVVIAHTNVAPETAVALDHAKRVGAPVVLITDNLAEALADDVEAAISAPIGKTGTFSSQAATLAVLEALILAVAAEDREQATEAMTLLNQLRDELHGLPSTAAGAADAPPRRPRRRR
ncbi:MurR/RpiR family transcriptional regulator [Streptomyces silvisoli]|uniref:MurR/RpiR family transcriptional regulator n=1 Tax=Streptomyces silvisoli TaxID=3034235 RepID=A0ABT5ZFK5_9ACTN|nr:MurR/RpiR family transcriptional regulator [Streptomyces silvisoli]MDF3287768.1 MurR/RpiR family transcriptional regulator [Streptomyces silvisoli]